MLEDLQIRHYSPTTIRIYLHSIAEFFRHFHQPPDQPGPEYIRQYQLISHEREAGLAVYLYPDSLRVALFLDPHSPSQNHGRPHPLPTARTKIAADPEPGRSEGRVGSAVHAA
jgi:hypothetical protein